MGSTRWMVWLAPHLVPLALWAQGNIDGHWDRVRLHHDALHYDIRVSLPSTDSLLRAQVATRWKLTDAGPVVLDLDSALTVSAVSVDGRVVSWRRRGATVVIPVTAAAGGVLSTTISYYGVPIGGLVIRGQGARRTIFADNWPDRARDWLAAQDHPADKASVSWSIEAPAGWTVVANGRLEGIDSLPAERVRWKFSQPEPIPVYTMVLGMARLVSTTLAPAGCPARCIPVSLLTAAEDSAFAATGPFRRASEIVNFFIGKFGPFPYGLLRHVESTTIFGGMENATEIFYDYKAIHEGRLHESTVAHETAHQWFGDAVTETDWHHVWLSEGFATYADALWTEHVGGDSALRATMRRQRDTILVRPATDRPILDSSVTDRMKLLNSNAYEKGSWVLHSLRGLVGDDAFFRGLQRYLRTFQHANTLSGDFASVLGREAGRDLRWYFRQALTQPGYPVLEVATEVDGGHLLITIRQVQRKEWGLYRIPNLQIQLDNRVVTVAVTRATTILATHWESAEPPRVIRVDPEGWWLLDVRGER